MTGIDRIQVAESKPIINRVKSIMIRVADESGSDIDEILDVFPRSFKATCN